MTMAARLKVYQPDGALTGYLPQPVSWSASFPLDDVSALSLDYAAAADGSALLDGPCEVAVEVNGGAGWVEPPNGRYLRLERSGDSAKGASDVRTYTCPGYASLLDGIAVIPAIFIGDPDKFTSDGKRKFLSANVGQILNTIRSDAALHVAGLRPGLTFGFTASVDSAGNAWNKSITIYLDAGLSILTVLDNLAQQGQCTWRMDGRVLNVYNANTGLYVTRTRKVFADISEAPLRSSIAGLLHTAFLVGDEGLVWKVSNPSAITPWGTSVKIINQGGVRDSGTANNLIAAELDAGRGERREYSLAGPATDAPHPLIDYQVGDKIPVRNFAGSWENMSVQQVTLRSDTKGLKWAATVNDRFTDASVRTAKRLRGIVNGATGDSGTGSLPKPPPVGSARPKAPAGLVVGTLGYWFNGSPRSSVQANWDAVTLSTNNLAIDIAYYAIRATGGRTARSETTSAAFDGLEPNKSVTVQVCAVSTDGVAGAWSAGVAVTTAAPTADIDPPTPFALSSANGMVTIAWDKKIQAGGAPFSPPLYLAHVEVQEGTSAAGPWVDAGAVTTAVPALIRTHTGSIGQTRWYRGRCISTIGAEGGWGPTTSITITSAVDTAINAAQASASAAASAAAAAQTTADGKNRIFAQAGTPTASAAGDQWFVLSAGKVVDIRVWNGTSWVSYTLVASSVIVPSSIGTVLIEDGAVTANKLTADSALINKIFTDVLVAGKVSGAMIQGTAIDGKTVTGAVVRTAATGARTQLDTNGLRVIDSGGNDLVRLGFSYPTGLAVRDPKTGGMLEASGMIFGSQFLTPNGHPRGWDTVAVNTPNYARVGQYATAISSLSGRANLVAYVAIAGNSGGTELNSMDVMVQVHSVSNPSSPTANRLHAAQNPVSWTNLSVMNTETVILMEPASFGTAGNAYAVVWVRNRNSGSRSLKAWVGPIGVLPA